MSVLPFPHDRTEVGRIVEAMEKRLPPADLARVRELSTEWKCDLVEAIVAIVGAYCDAERGETREVEAM